MHQENTDRTTTWIYNRDCFRKYNKYKMLLKHILVENSKDYIII